MGQVIFQPVNGPPAVVPEVFLFTDFLAFLFPPEFYLFNGRIYFFQLGGVSQVGVVQLFEQDFRFRYLLGAVGMIHKGQEDIQAADAFLEFVVQLGLARLAFQAGHLPADFRGDVIEPQQVSLGGSDFAQRFRLSGLVAGDTGSLLDESPAFIRSCVRNRADVALLNNRVGFSAHAAAHKDIVDVFQAAGLFVDVINPFAGAVHAPGNHDLREILEFFRAGSAFIGEGQRDFSHVERRGARGAGENDVFHRLAAQLLRALFTHDPPEGIHDIAFSTAIGPHNRGDPLREFDHEFFVEGFKTGNFQSFKPHLFQTPFMGKSETDVQSEICVLF